MDIKNERVYHYFERIADICCEEEFQLLHCLLAAEDRWNNRCVLHQFPLDRSLRTTHSDIPNIRLVARATRSRIMTKRNIVYLGSYCRYYTILMIFSRRINLPLSAMPVRYSLICFLRLHASESMLRVPLIAVHRTNSTIRILTNRFYRCRILGTIGE